MNIRKYVFNDCKECAQLFYQTVHTVNIFDYTKQQCDAWAPKHMDLETFHHALSE